LCRRRGANALVGGDHVVAREIEEVIEVVIKVLLHLLAGHAKELSFDHQLIETLDVQ
jgi:hypothetical protein